MSRISCILYPPTVDYDYLLQRPQQLMKSFSGLQIPSYYMNINLFNSPKGIKQINPYFYLFNQVDIKPYLKNIKPVIYFTLPDHINSINQYNPSLVVFDSVDEPSEEFEPWSHHYHRAVQLADVVLATSDKLYKMAANVNPNTHLVPNGCDYDYFSRASYKDMAIPEDMKNIKGPVIGFMGAIATWCDLRLVDRLAVNFPHCSIVMIGPFYNVTAVPQRPNIYWLGLKSYQQLAAYVQKFDVGIIPFRISSMVESINPIKMWEYMASGIPIVTTAIPEARKYHDLVLCSENEEEFMQNIKLALNNDSSERKNQRMALAQQNSWIIRAQQIVQIIEDRLIEKGGSTVPRLELIPEGIPYQLPPQVLRDYPAYVNILTSSRQLTVSRGTSFRYSANSGNKNIRLVQPESTSFSGGSPKRHLNIVGRAAFKYKTERSSRAGAVNRNE